MESDRVTAIMARLNAPADLFATGPGGRVSRRHEYVRTRARVWWELHKQCPDTGQWLSLTKIADATTGRSHVSVLQALRVWGPVFEAEERAATGHGPRAVSVNQNRMQEMITRTAKTNAKAKREYAQERLAEALAFLGYTDAIFENGRGESINCEDWAVQARREVYDRMHSPLNDQPGVKCHCIDLCIGISSGTTRYALNRNPRPRVVMPREATEYRDQLLAARNLTMEVFSTNRANTEPRDELLFCMRNFCPRGERMCIKLAARVTVGEKRMSMVVSGAKRHVRRMKGRKVAA